MTASIEHQRDRARKHLDKEFANTITLIETALDQIKFHYEAFQAGDDDEKARRASSAIHWMRRMTSSIDIPFLADEAARLDILSSIDA
jgi:hypothetical protein